jgi:hypothetical protein
MALNRAPPSPVPPMPSHSRLTRPNTAIAAGYPSRVQGSIPIGNQSTPELASPAAQRLSATLNEKSLPKNVKARLRRAFSFGSAQEMHKAATANSQPAERAKLRKEAPAPPVEQENELQEANIAAEQEANGMGSQIYSGQGQFAVSTDNISVSSTASSASMMLRKVGRGMKRSTRNLRNLFRPKSMIGSHDGENGSTTELSLSTVEAERERVNVNLHPHDRAGGGTGYPRLERNSMEINPQDVSDAIAGAEHSRKSIVGSHKDRAEVLGSIRKGILKRNGTGSNASSPSMQQAELSLPSESGPATPSDRYSVDSNTQNDGYFAPPPALGNSAGMTGSTRSLPTPSRNISFNSKLQFFDVWSPSEYDRRGDIATCNRLTPMLAQQIKEELNTFKMVSFHLCLYNESNIRRKWKFIKIPSLTPTFSKSHAISYRKIWHHQRHCNLFCFQRHNDPSTKASFNTAIESYDSILIFVCHLQDLGEPCSSHHTPTQFTLLSSTSKRKKHGRLGQKDHQFGFFSTLWSRKHLIQIQTLISTPSIHVFLGSSPYSFYSFGAHHKVTHTITSGVFNFYFPLVRALVMSCWGL